MAIQFTDFTNTKLLDSPAKTIFEDVLKGYQMSQEPAKMKEEQSARELANQLKKLDLDHKPKEYALDDRGKSLANAMKAEALKYLPTERKMKEDINLARINKLNNPVNSAKFNGIMANFVAAHPDATDEQKAEFADKLVNAQIEHLQTSTERSSTLNKTQDIRDSTPLVKKHKELAAIDSGVMPGTQTKLSPEKQSKMKNDLLLSIIKDTTDPRNREKLINARNLDITLDGINPKHLTQYSGAEGKINKTSDALLESAGGGSEDYKNYKRAISQAVAGAKQLSNYLKASIQPAEQEKLEKLLSPEAWDLSPELAKENFEFMRDLLKRETQTLVRSVTDPTVFSADIIKPTDKKVWNLATRSYE